MERTFMPHFADGAELAMPFGPIFIGDSAFSFCVSPNEKEERFPACFTSVIAIWSGKCCIAITTSNIFQPIFFSRSGIRSDRLLREGNGNKILKEARKICTFEKIRRKILRVSFSMRYTKLFSSTYAIHIVVDWYLKII